MKSIGATDPTVNEVLRQLLAALRADLGRHFVGMYLSGSLALGDFDPTTSDIDSIVITDADLPSSVVAALGRTHARLGSSGSPWASRLEVAYIPMDALRINVPATARFPQLEKDRALGLYPPESGWVIQLSTLREHGVVVTGPDSRSLIPPIAADDVRRASAAHAVTWAQQARHDPAWLTWVRTREHQAFVVVTLCRMLYSLQTGTVASKPAAAEWMLQHVGGQWAELIHRAVNSLDGEEAASDREVDETIALIRYVAGQYQEWMRDHPA
jgi:hypothetical protein